MRWPCEEKKRSVIKEVERWRMLSESIDLEKKEEV
jgi:hypothetical protein